MWGDLAGRVAQNLKENAGDLRGALHNVAQVVAPPLNDDDDEEYEYYEEADDEDLDGDYYEEEEITESNDDKTGFSSFLQHALDDEEAEHQVHVEQEQRLMKHQLLTDERPVVVDTYENDDDNDDEIVDLGRGNSDTGMTGGVTTAPTNIVRSGAGPRPDDERISPLIPKDVVSETFVSQNHTSTNSNTTAELHSRADALIQARRMARLEQETKSNERPAPTEGTAVTPLPTASRTKTTDDVEVVAMKNEKPPVTKTRLSVPSMPGHTTKQHATTSTTAYVATVKEEQHNEAVPVQQQKATEDKRQKATTTPPLRSLEQVPSALPPKVVANGARATAATLNTSNSSRPRTEIESEPPTSSTPTIKDVEPPPQQNQPSSSSSSSLAKDLEKQCQDLQQQLSHAERHIVELQQDMARRLDEEEQWRSRHAEQLQLEQARMVEAATESVTTEHKRELQELKESFQFEQLSLERQLQEEQNVSKQQTVELERLLRETQARLDAAEAASQNALAKQEASAAQEQKRQTRSVRMAEDKLAQTRALLDERVDEVKELKASIKKMKATMHEHNAGFAEAEEEMDELHTENETLRQTVHDFEIEREEWKKQIDHLETQREKMAGLQMEIKMLREERDRAVAKNVSVSVNAESSQAELESERDAALALARDVEQQLKASLADLDVANSDTARVMKANENLQNALEAFQSERDAELGLMGEQRAAADEATAAAHAAAIEATHEANEARMREVQAAADTAVKNTMVHVESLESKLEEYRKDNFQLRRSLDEAISRLQTSQEDVIDRILMKNILLDWFAKTGKGKRDVLEVMASLLHFTDEEKDKIHIGDSHGALGSIVDAVTAPLPPSKADIDHLQGDTVREKWVNFLLAEIGEDEEGAGDDAKAATNGEVSTINDTNQ